MSTSALGESCQKKTSGGFPYTVVEWKDEHGKLTKKRVYFRLDEVPASELMELFGTEFCIMPIDCIRIHSALYGDHGDMSTQIYVSCVVKKPSF